MSTGKKSVARVDAFDKVTGRARYTDDLCDRSALVARVLHSTIANGVVKRIDTSLAEQIEGVVKIVTCFDVPDFLFPTAGTPVVDRPAPSGRGRPQAPDGPRPLLRRRRGARSSRENEVAAAQALRAIHVEYEEYPFVLDQVEAMQDGAPQLHEAYPNNILAHTGYENGNYEEAIREEGLIRVEGWYDTPTVQHCHI